MGKQGQIVKRDDLHEQEEPERRRPAHEGRGSEQPNRVSGSLRGKPNTHRQKKRTVTLFAFDEDQGLSEHTAPYDALAQITDGEADITISGKTHHVKQGQIIIMPANQPHALKATTRFKMLLTMIRTK